MAACAGEVPSHALIRASVTDPRPLSCPRAAGVRVEAAGGLAVVTDAALSVPAASVPAAPAWRVSADLHPPDGRFIETAAAGASPLLAPGDMRAPRRGRYHRRGRVREPLRAAAPHAAGPPHAAGRRGCSVSRSPPPTAATWGVPVNRLPQVASAHGGGGGDARPPAVRRRSRTSSMQCYGIPCLADALACL